MLVVEVVASIVTARGVGSGNPHVPDGQDLPCSPVGTGLRFGMWKETKLQIRTYVHGVWDVAGERLK